MKPAIRSGVGGFTLVEVLVAVLVFGLLSAATYTVLDNLTAAASGLDERSGDFAELQRAVAFFDSDLRQLVSRAGRDRNGRITPALQGVDSALVGRRAGRDNPSQLPRSQLQQFGWRFDGEALVREAWAHVVPEPDAQPVGRSRFEQIRALQLRYRDASGSWHTQWPAGAGPGSLPGAVEYAFETARFGTVRRLIVL